MEVDSMTDLLSSFERDAAIRGMAPSTLTRYTWILKDFFKFMGPGNPLEATRKDMRDYVEEKRNRGLATRSISIHLSALSCFYEFAIFEELTESNPVRDIRKRYLAIYKSDSEKRVPKIISVEEAAEMVNSSIDVRDKALVLLLFKTGIRKHELMELDIDDINWSDQCILLKTTKKRSNRQVYFDDETATILRRWLKAREMRNNGGNPALFTSIWGGRLGRNSIDNVVHKAAFQAKLHDPSAGRREDRFTPHCCRHWFTTHLIRSGMPRDFVKELRGDARHEAIDIYNHIDKKELRESYLAHIPQLGI
jgi:integrase/recombinase XerD